MFKRKLLSRKGMILIGIIFLASALVAIVAFGPDFAMAQAQSKGKPDKPGKPGKPNGGKPEPSLYRISMSTSDGEMSIDTANCNGIGYVLAEWDDAHDYLHANGTMIDSEFKIRIPLLMQLETDVEWIKKYDAGKGISGIFDGCFGETGYYHGALFITFKKKRKRTYISFNWHFDYFTAPDVREHFSLFSDDIPFPAWTGEDISGSVNGKFDLHYYLNDPEEFIGYESLTGDLGRDFDFTINIEKITK